MLKGVPPLVVHDQSLCWPSSGSLGDVAGRGDVELSDLIVECNFNGLYLIVNRYLSCGSHRDALWVPGDIESGAVNEIISIAADLWTVVAHAKLGRRREVIGEAQQGLARGALWDRVAAAVFSTAHVFHGVSDGDNQKGDNQAAGPSRTFFLLLTFSSSDICQ